MLKQTSAGAIARVRRYTVPARSCEWPPALPIAVPRNTARSRFHEEFGKYVNYAALYSALSSSGLHEKMNSAPGLLRKYGSESTTRTLALALPLDHLSDTADPIEAYYRYLGQVAEERGLEDASDWVKALYSPFLRNAQNVLANKTPTTQSEVEFEQPVQGVDAGQANERQVAENKQMGPIDLASNDGMNLFEPESWLTESPTAQRLWKEGQ